MDITHKIHEMGNQLDRGIFPRVMNRGLVKPDDPSVLSIVPATEESHEKRSGETRPTTGSGAGAASGKRAASGSWSSSAAASVVGTSLEEQYRKEVATVLQVYPGAKVWAQAEGIWLLTESLVLPGLWQKAVFLTGVPFDGRRIVRSWGFWKGIPLRHPVWIGPRHTNCPDGSICAFEADDGAWTIGNPLVTLLDIYTVWAFRHLHLQVLQRWPGPQSARHAYERVTEFQPTELCGCNSGKLYRDCCQQMDLAGDRCHQAMNFFNAGFGVRKVPDAVVNLIRTENSPPEIGSLLPFLRV